MIILRMLMGRGWPYNTTQDLEYSQTETKTPPSWNPVQGIAATKEMTDVQEIGRMV